MELDPKAPQQSPDFPDCFYRVTVKGLIVREGKVLMALDFAGVAARAKNGEWELPGGGLDFGENPREALAREIKEEMGLEATSIAEQPTYIWTHKRENRRGMGWHYIMAVAYKVEVANLDFTPSEECRAIDFFDKETLLALRAEDKLGDQMAPFAEMFDPKDFDTLK